MFCKASIARSAVRWASTRSVAKSDKITVQLLQDCLPLGIRGQVVRVKPAYMRNFLHVDNKACYILENQGPRIPVVEKPRAPVVIEKKVAVENKSVKKEATPALSLDDLSNLFTKSRSTKVASAAPAQIFTAEASTSSYSLAELSDSLPGTFTVSSPNFPVTKELLATSVFNSTGIEVPLSAITLKDNKGENVTEIESTGLYSWVFSAPGQSSTLQRNLSIQ